MVRLMSMLALAVLPTSMLLAGNQLTRAPKPGKLLNRIAFGSCNKEDQPQPMWQGILKGKPDLWIWTGDIIYGDTHDMDLMWKKYQMLLTNEGYQQLLKAVPVTGVWDDHDYGWNNAGKEYRKRAESQQLLLDFLDIPQSSPRRVREGVYASHILGPPGKRIKIIMLDTRYHREKPGPLNDILGHDQWTWLEDQLSGEKTALTLIVSSIQVVAPDHRHEKWANFKSARKRLMTTIARHKTPGVIFISGDRHLAEISVDPNTPTGYPMHDITASGMTHAWTDFPGEPNRYRYKEVVHQRNHGMLVIDWKADPVSISLQIRGLEAEVLLEKKIALTALQ